MQRTLSRQEHDEKVGQIALQLLANGFDVKARVEGWFSEPDYIFEYRPDIIATKDDRWIIVEVKKADTDWPKIAALERFQEERGYILYIVSPDEDWTTLLNPQQRDRARVFERP